MADNDPKTQAGATGTEQPSPNQWALRPSLSDEPVREISKQEFKERFNSAYGEPGVATLTYPNQNQWQTGPALSDKDVNNINKIIKTGQEHVNSRQFGDGLKTPGYIPPSEALPGVPPVPAAAIPNFNERPFPKKDPADQPSPKLRDVSASSLVGDSPIPGRPNGGGPHSSSPGISIGGNTNVGLDPRGNNVFGAVIKNTGDKVTLGATVPIPGQPFGKVLGDWNATIGHTFTNTDNKHNDGSSPGQGNNNRSNPLGSILHPDGQNIAPHKSSTNAKPHPASDPWHGAREEDISKSTPIPKPRPPETDGKSPGKGVDGSPTQEGGRLAGLRTALQTGAVDEYFEQRLGQRYDGSARQELAKAHAAAALEQPSQEQQPGQSGQKQDSPQKAESPLQMRNA